MCRLRLLVLLPLLAACDPVVGSTLRLLPPLAVAGDTSYAVRSAQLTEALRATGRLALRFGLAPHRHSGRCTRAWSLSSYARTDPGKRHGTLQLCATLSSDGALQVHLREGPSVDWSAKGDSLRRELADTLARYGRVDRI
jgi:hypothetical protein